MSLFQPMAVRFAHILYNPYLDPVIYENKAKISSHHGVELQKKIHGECHIFNQSEQSCLEMLTFLTNEN